MPPTVFQIGRRPETSLVDSWQPAPPEETEITGVPCVRRVSGDIGKKCLKMAASRKMNLGSKDK